MKTQKIYIFLFIYVFSCLGLMVDFHYCGGDFVSVNLYHANEDNCCGEHEETASNCCNDKYLLINTDDTETNKTYTVTQNHFLKIVSPAYPQPTFLFYNSFALGENIEPLNHAPPNRVLMPLFIKHNILLI